MRGDEIFCYHEVRSPVAPTSIPSLLVIDHASKQASFFPVGNLQAAGWKITADDLRRSLPRFQQTPTIVSGAGGSVERAASMSRDRQKFEQRIRSGR